jgi:hypothetical protein
MTQALNAFYGIGKVIEAGRSAQGGILFWGCVTCATDVQCACPVALAAGSATGRARSGGPAPAGRSGSRGRVRIGRLRVPPPA